MKPPMPMASVARTMFWQIAAGSLKGLDQDERVIYVWTLNKALFPGLRIGTQSCRKRSCLRSPTPVI